MRPRLPSRPADVEVGPSSSDQAPITRRSQTPGAAEVPSRPLLLTPVPPPISPSTRSRPGRSSAFGPDSESVSSSELIFDSLEVLLGEDGTTEPTTSDAVSDTATASGEPSRRTVEITAQLGRYIESRNEHTPVTVHSPWQRGLPPPLPDRDG